MINSHKGNHSHSFGFTPILNTFSLFIVTNIQIFAEKHFKIRKKGDSCYESKRKYKRSLLHRSTLNTNKNNTRTNKLITDSSNHYGYEIPLGQSRPKSQMNFSPVVLIIISLTISTFLFFHFSINYKNLSQGFQKSFFLFFLQKRKNA